MNNRDNLIKEVKEFIANDEKAMLITGPNQYEKHKVVIALLGKYAPKSTVLLLHKKL